MLMPKKVKFRKQQKGKRRGKAWRGSTLSFGEYGLKVMECGYITDRQIEASLFEMEGVTPETAAEAMRLASHKLPLRTKFVQRPGAEKTAVKAPE